MDGKSSRTVIVADEQGELRRVDLATCIDLGYSTEEDLGVRVVAVYLRPRRREVIVETYSFWEDRRNKNGACEGTRYHVANRDEIARMAGHGLDIDDARVADLIPELK